MGLITPNKGDIETAITLVSSALIEAKDEHTGWLASSNDKRIAGAIDRYIEGPVQGWRKRGENMPEQVPENQFIGWKKAGEAHLDAASDWGAENDGVLDLAYETIKEIPKHVKRDVKKAATVAGEVASEGTTEVLKGFLSSPGGFAVLTVVVGLAAWQIYKVVK